MGTVDVPLMLVCLPFFLPPTSLGRSQTTRAVQGTSQHHARPGAGLRVMEDWQVGSRPICR